ncbi:143_t:CDS:2 [Ambispora gerdemannii]|uniref:143_t:CDS:1 n=1 Tax=Ambispora gerdemannii TaxID=144530 RepID=A0A9N9APS6_9GLOM|nr:143_t:CDS:2 [Ambispora gerdemannii]
MTTLSDSNNKIGFVESQAIPNINIDNEIEFVEQSEHPASYPVDDSIQDHDLDSDELELQLLPDETEDTDVSDIESNQRSRRGDRRRGNRRRGDRRRGDRRRGDRRRGDRRRGDRRRGDRRRGGY